ncbi:hypothetical protein CK203_062143 [Vitis vinifera]|uniref:Aspartic peptidase DDI1-type domain-containing protein n=1 Tax=Vitis vinifera TaxID=29760 RepID=A0A438G903_VITVI|nr:hypothetical protein CK203_062143 [Vitis vinifera]
MTRRLEELELKRIHEVQAVAEAPVQVKLVPIVNHLNIWWRNALQFQLKGKCIEIKQMLLDNSGPITMRLWKYLQLKLEESSKFLMEGQSNSIPTAGSTISAIFKEDFLLNLTKIPKPTPKPHVEKEEEIKKGKEMEDKESEISEEKKDSDSTMKAIPEKELLKEEMLKKSTSPPFPQALHGKKGIRNAAEILEVLRQVKVNIPLLDMIKQVPTYAKFLKDLCTIKRGLTVNKKAFLTEQVSAILQCKSPLKYKDPGSPTISVMIGGKVVEKALLDLGASVNLLPYSVYKQLGLGELKPTTITLSLADRSVKIPRGEANLVPIILGRPFLATSNAIINCRNGLMQLTFGNMTLDLNIFYMSKKQITPEEEEGRFSESPIGLATLQSWRKIEGILPLFNEEEEAAVKKKFQNSI